MLHEEGGPTPGALEHGLASGPRLLDCCSENERVCLHSQHVRGRGFGRIITRNPHTKKKKRDNAAPPRYLL